MTEVQTAFTQGHPAQRLFELLLGAALELTGSEYAFMGEVVSTPEGPPTLKTHSVQSRGGLTFSHLQGLCNDVLVSGLPVVSLLPIWSHSPARHWSGPSPCGASSGCRCTRARDWWAWWAWPTDRAAMTTRPWRC